MELRQDAPVEQEPSTRSRLIRAAEVLLAEHGVEAVSLREIGRSAGAKNIAAAQYHFGDRAGLIQAILEKHTPAVSVIRHRMLDDWETSASSDLRGLVDAMVRPQALKLDDPDGGLEYLQIYGELVNRPSGIGVPLVEGARNSIERWAALIEPWLGPDGDIFHRRFLAVRINAAELARRARIRSGGDHQLFVEHLVDVVQAMLVAPSAPPTVALLHQHRPARRRPSLRDEDRDL
jgi:AcrR family transcriptional regulator